MVEALLRRLNEIEDDGDLGVTLQKLEFRDGGLDLYFKLNASEIQPPEVWVVNCRRVVDVGVNGEQPTTHVLLDGNHPSLWPFVDATVELSFRSKPANTDHVIAALYESHRAVAKNWIPFERFLNSNLSLRLLLEGGDGQLAKGPVRLIREYARVLKEAGMTHSTLEMGMPKHWVWDEVGGHFESYPADLTALVFGESHCVGRDWTSSRVA